MQRLATWHYLVRLLITLLRSCTSISSLQMKHQHFASPQALLHGDAILSLLVDVSVECAVVCSLYILVHFCTNKPKETKAEKCLSKGYLFHLFGPSSSTDWIHRQMNGTEVWSRVIGCREKSFMVLSCSKKIFRWLWNPRHPSWQ